MSSEGILNEAAFTKSRLVEIKGPEGQRILAYIDEGPENEWNERFVVLAPRYGETKKNNLQLSYTFVANGFKVIRYDQTNHIGESDGSMAHFTLSGATSDIVAVVDYVDRHFEPSEISCIALSLSARSGLRACATEPRISRLVNIVGMVDMDSTLKSIYKRDFFGELTEGADWRMVDILGFEIDGKHFHDDLLRSGMKALAGTIEDASKIDIPVLHLSAARDLWVCREDVEQVIGVCRNGQLEAIPDVGHEINENSTALHTAVTRSLLFCADGLGLEAKELKLPNKHEIIRQNKLERQRLQQILKFTDTEGDFWSDYLGKFGIIEDAHYYADYFHSLAGMLGTICGGDVILDAGCGNGFYGVNVIRALHMESMVGRKMPSPVHYCGVDLTAQGLERSYSRQVDELASFVRDHGSEESGLSYSYRKIDFDSINGRATQLPFADCSVSKVCCSLVVSYLKEPLSLFREFRRVLKPGGVAVVSSMKPGCDMTVLYHEYVDKDTPDKSRDEAANRLLSAAGKIKLKKDTGIYNFFTGEELEALALKAGFRDVRSSRSFGDQANVARIVK